MAMADKKEKLYYSGVVLWNSIKENKTLLICGGLIGETLGLLYINGRSLTLEQVHKAFTSVCHYKLHIGALLGGSVITGVSKIVLNTWSEEVEKEVIRNTPNNSPDTKKR